MTYAKIALALFACTGLLAAADPAVGTWKLNVGKSKYSPGPGPKSATMKYAETAKGLTRTGESFSAEGQRSSFEYTAQHDGKDYPVTGSELFDGIVLKRVNDRTTEAVLKKGGKVVSNARRVISADGKTLTITTNGTNAKGEKTHNVAVYDKQ